MQTLPDPQDFDPTRLRRLLDLVGPAEAAPFLAQLDRDLTDCASAISVAVSDWSDWTSLREASHVLISLAGSAGALHLQALAEALNAAAHDRDGTATAHLHRQVVPDLASLINLVRATPDPFGNAEPFGHAE